MKKQEEFDFTDEELELREEIYNRVIQEHAYLANIYEGDELQDEVNKIVDDEFNEENNTLSYDQLMEWDKDDLAHHILSYQEEARRTKNQAKYPY
jgi:predicted DsbA family dithiol-disulfide isomerase